MKDAARPRLAVRQSLGAATLIAALLPACGGADDARDASAAAAPDAALRDDRAPAAGRAAGILELDGQRHPFRIVRCDLTGTRYEGMLLHGAGTAEDGRTLSVQVERIDSGDRVDEHVFVSFGSIMDGDNWAADRHRWPDGRWFADESGMDPVPDGMIRTSGAELVVEADLLRESDGTRREGMVRASCRD